MATAETVVVVVGRGETRIGAIRDATSDSTYLDNGLARALGDGAERDGETGLWCLMDDAWCVVVPAGSVSTADLDTDPAVRAWYVFEPNGA